MSRGIEQHVTHTALNCVKNISFLSSIDCVSATTLTLGLRACSWPTACIARYNINVRDGEGVVVWVNVV